jgi:DNA repair exonuclease SbcCD nuclease subunit
MKRLIFSDLHLHPWSYGATVTEHGYNSRLWAQKLALDEMLTYAIEHEIEYAYFLGDLFHTHGNVPTQALAIAADFFRELRRHCSINALVGNHDMANKSGSIHALSFLEPTEVIENGHWVNGGVNIGGLSYTTDDDELKQFLDICGDTGGIALLHQGVANVQLSSGYIIDERLSPEMIPDNVVAFSGHYHFHKRVSQNLTVVGNLAALNWSDANQTKGFVVYDDETGTIEHIEQHSAPNFVSFDQPQFRGNNERSVDGNFLRLNYPVAVEDQEEIRKGWLKQGALTVEFPQTVTAQTETTRMKAGEELTVESLVEAFARKDMDPRRREVGEEVRSETYSVQS